MLENLMVNMTWEEKRNKIFWFPQIVECDAFPIRRVHPLKQKEAKKLYEELNEDDRVAEIYIFGSSVNIRCHIHSDTDVAILLSDDSRQIRGEISEKIQEICDWNADVIWLNGEDKNSRFYKEVLRGVRIK